MAASKLLSLDVRKTRMAIGIAAAQTGGIDSSGTMCNPGDSGNAASRGVQAAMLAQLGFTGRDNALEQKYGFAQFLGEDADVEAIVRDFPDSLHLAKSPISLKKYPCQYPNHRHIDAILALYQDEPWRPQDVEALQVEVTLMPGDSNFNNHSIINVAPHDGMAGKFSVPYTAAVAAVDGFVDIQSFTDDKRFSRAVVEMLARVTVKVSDERPTTFQKMWSEVTLRFTDGRSRRRRVELLRGVSGGEPLTREERLSKFMHCASLAISHEQALSVVAAVDQIESLANIDPLCTLLRGAAK
jgi:2-methylcitrate dehydratase PrpD